MMERFAVNFTANELLHVGYTLQSEIADVEQALESDECPDPDSYQECLSAYQGALAAINCITAERDDVFLGPICGGGRRQPLAPTTDIPAAERLRALEEEVRDLKEHLVWILEERNADILLSLICREVARKHAA